MKPGEHGGNLVAASEKYGRAPEEFVDFSSNINPLGIPGELRQALQEELQSLTHYPDPQAGAARKGLSEYLEVPPGCSLPTNGGAEAIQLATDLVGRCHHPRSSLRGVVLEPTFSEYRGAVERVGGRVLSFRLTAESGFDLDRDKFAGFCSELQEHQDKRPPLFFLCNPNNPTGKLLSRAQVLNLKRLIHEQVSQDSVLVVDEAFIDFVEDERGSSVRWAAVDDPRLVVTGSLTKMFALPGLRIGYAVASPQVIGQLQELQLPWSVNALAQRAAQELPGLDSFVSRTRRVVQEERDYLFERLNRLPQLQVFPSATNYLLMKMDAENHSVTELEDFLGQRGYLIRNCDNFEGLGEGFFRTAVKGRKANRELIELICRFFGMNRGDD